jgi:hypothetical protein
VTAAARKLAPRPSALEVFIARAEARALLWQAGAVDLHGAVDELQAAAVRDGLVAELGQDRVQELMVEAFAPVRDDLAVRNLTADDDESEPADDAAVLNLTGTDDTQARGDVPIATLWAAEYLIQQGNAERFRDWLDRHSADERIAIRRHLEAKRCR